MDINGIVVKLAIAKDEEAAVKAKRMQLEDQLAKAIGVPETWTGSTTNDIGGYKVTCKRADNVKIDCDAVTSLMGQSPELGHFGRTIFRWKPEIDKKAWDAAPADIIKVYSAAVTRTPGKVGFTLKLKDNK